ncbi:MAG: hypothetical protein NVS3B16_09790 [Vulcanimicrobiaceae bacterium]
MMHRSIGRALCSARVVATFLVATIAVATTSLPAFAIGGTTGSLTGVIVDDRTKLPLAGVTVAATSPVQDARATSDAKGFYSLTGLPVDTYTVSFQLAGYESQSVTGVTVQGDQTITVDGRLAKALSTIGRVTSRSVSSAFQPKQTTDTYQVSGRQLDTALGKTFAPSQTQLQSSVPGITQTVYGSSSIRGSTRTEIAYQYENVNYTDAATNQFANSLQINGIQSLQVNPGAGDASQGNAGAGAVNLVSKRGSRPAFGTLDLEALTTPFTHQLGFDYGWATPNGRISNYTGFLGNDQYRGGYGLNGQPAVLQGTFFGLDYSYSRDLINNFIMKVGKNSQNTIQLFYQNRQTDFLFNHGGIEALCYKTCDPNIREQNSSTAFFALTSPGDRLANFQSIVGLLPYQTSPTQKLLSQGYQHQPVEFYKLEFDQTPNSSTYWANRIYRIASSAIFASPYVNQSPASSRINNGQGGFRTGLSGTYQQQLNSKNLVSLSYVYETSAPAQDSIQNLNAYRALTPARTAKGYELVDFLAPGAPCPTTDPSQKKTKLALLPSGSPCGYLSGFASILGTTAPRVPNVIFSAPGHEQQYGFGLRDQLSVSRQLKLDLGLRYDVQNYQLLNTANTDFTFTNDVVHPGILQPRLAAAYQLGPRDAIRASYGRSVEFTPGAIINQPISVDPAFYRIPSRDSRTGVAATYCGPTNTATCTSYGQQLHDEYVLANSPEAFAVKPATFNNYDFSYSHEFAGNVGVKVTPFYKRGYDVNISALTILGTDPVTNLPLFGPSVLTNLGLDKTTGVEFLLTKDATYGLSGFLTLTYVNRLQNIPPGYGGQLEDFYPSAPPQSLALGSLFRAGYLSPLNGRLGLTYRSRGGFKINPIVSYDKGFPIGAGTLTSAFVNGVPTVVPNTNINIPGFGAVSNTGAPSGVTQYVDPVNPGTVFKPVIAATRGTAESPLSGGVLSKARFNTDISLAYSPPGARSTIGVYVSNLFNQIYAEPGLNPRYQPVATGVAGPQTGQISTVGSLGAANAGGLGFANFGPERFGSSSYNLTPSNSAIGVRLYYQLAL